MIVFVTGPPGAGKSTLARALAPRLNMPLVAKDDIKESLSDSLRKTGLRWSKRLGAATWDLIWVLIERAAASGGSAIFESNFYPALQRERLIGLRQAHPFSCFEVHCTADPDVLKRRILERVRHSVHHFSGLGAPGWWKANGPLELDEHVLRLDTSDSEPFDLDLIVSAITEVRGDA